jgi:twinkle protein
MDYSGDIIPLRKRAILEDTCKKFNVRFDAASQALRFPYCNSSGQVIAFKEKTAAKDITWKGKNEEHQLFGQQLFGGGKTLVITEGEEDAMSVWQARPNWPVVSVPNGANGARKSLEKQLKWALGFDEIVLFFDNDGPGQAAANECASLFPHERVFIARTDQYKDANEALVAKDTDAIRQAIWNKRQFSPKTVIDGIDLFEIASRPLAGRDANWPFDSLNAVTGGLRLRELVTVTAGSGVGKSTLCGEVAQGLVDQGHNVGYIGLEEGLQRTALRLMSVKANKPLHISNEIPQEEFRQAFDASVGSGHVFLRDGFGSVDPEAILSDIRFMTMAKGVTWVILDHLSILLSGNDSGDERKLIDVTMTKLRSFVEETGIGMILISHLRRPQNDKGHEDGGKVSLGQLRGSHAIVQLSDLVIAIQRNLSAGESHSELVVLKNRFNGKTGPAGFISYNNETGRMLEDATASFKQSKLTPTTRAPDDYLDF